MDASGSHLVLVRIVKQDALGHKVADHGVAAQGRHVGSNDRQHLGDEALHEATQPTFLPPRVKSAKISRNRAKKTTTLAFGLLQ